MVSFHMSDVGDRKKVHIDEYNTENKFDTVLEDFAMVESIMRDVRYLT